MGYHGAVQLTDRHLEDKQAVAACNQRSSNMQRRCSRVLAKYGLTTAVGGKTPAADLYYAAVAKLIETGKVTELGAPTRSAQRLLWQGYGRRAIPRPVLAAEAQVHQPLGPWR